MDQLGKNRVIGSFVLISAALLFSPSILNPKNHRQSGQADSRLTVSVDNRLQSGGVDNQQATPVTTLPQSSGNNVVAMPTQQTVAMTQNAMIPAKPMPPGLTSAVDVRRPIWISVASALDEKTGKEQLKLIQTKYPAKLVATPSDDGTFYRVLVGPFADDQNALKKMQAQLKNDGLNALIVR